VSPKHNTSQRTRHEVDHFDPAAANSEKTEKLRRIKLQRRARSHGFELRHSAYGYSLIDAAHNRLDDRNDLTLDEVVKRLDAASAKP
jgi:hypothetical protein